MKNIAFIIFMLLFCSAPAVAGEPWSKGEVALEATFLTLQYIDYKQTQFIAANDEYGLDPIPDTPSGLRTISRSSQIL